MSKFRLKEGKVYEGRIRVVPNNPKFTPFCVPEKEGATTPFCIRDFAEDGVYIYVGPTPESASYSYAEEIVELLEYKEQN